MHSKMFSPLMAFGGINRTTLPTSRNITKLLSVHVNKRHFLEEGGKNHQFISSRSYKILTKNAKTQVVTWRKWGRYDNWKNESTQSSKPKALLKSEAQLKLAHVMSKCPIESFPLFKDKDMDENDIEFGQLFTALKDCQQNQLNNVLYYPSVSTILNSTMPVESLIALDRWKKLKISQLGEQGFRDYQKGLFRRGSLLHSNIKNFIETRDESSLVINETVEKLWKSLSPVLDLFQNVQLSETPVSHPFLCYKGIVDCVAFYSGKLVIIEWKTSEKQKPALKDLYDNPLQAVAYLGAINYESSHGLGTDEIVLVYAYEDGTKAQIHHLTSEQCVKYWNQWLLRLKSHWGLTSFRPT